MNSKVADTNYRALYGKLFSALTHQFGVRHLTEIEDAIQNSFLKSIKSWKPGKMPGSKEDWLYVVAKNDLINQLKREQQFSSDAEEVPVSALNATTSDLRLEAILLVASAITISRQAKIVFVLKAIFGLNVREISESTLLGSDAIYKSISRVKTALQKEYQGKEAVFSNVRVTKEEVMIVNEILYAVFNAGFDSFSEKQQSIVNEDLCLESFSLARLLHQQYQMAETSNLLALFAFHSARIIAKVQEGKLISFFNQDRQLWNDELIQLGFHYLTKPVQLDKHYLEALIASKYMATATFSQYFWMDIIKLYEILLKVAPSPIVSLNYCYCLHQAERRPEAMEVLRQIETQLPSEHVYLSLLKAELLKTTDPKQSAAITTLVMEKMYQDIRKAFLMETASLPLTGSETVD